MAKKTLDVIIHQHCTNSSITLMKTSRFSVFDIQSTTKKIINKRSKKLKAKAAVDITSPSYILVDIDANLLHEALKDNIAELRQQAYEAGIKHLIIPGCSIVESKKSLELATTVISKQDDDRLSMSYVYGTIGIHPYSVPLITDLNSAMNEMEALLTSNIGHCRAIGETGVDTSDGFPSLQQQLPFFEMHVKLAVKYQLPLFLHQRGAFDQFCHILIENDAHKGNIPIVVHCFTGSKKELEQYVSYGFYIGITGYIMRKDDAAVDELIEALKDGVVPLDKLMIETDAPYMGFKGCRQGFPGPSRKFPNVPTSLNLILRELAKALNISEEDLATITTRNATQFFKLFL